MIQETLGKCMKGVPGHYLDTYFHVDFHLYTGIILIC